MSDTLKPCPFCGSDGFVNQHPDAPEYWVACSRCSALTDTALPTEAEAIAAWNRRAAIGQVEQPTLPLSDEQIDVQAMRSAKHIGKGLYGRVPFDEVRDFARHLVRALLSAAPPAPAQQQPKLCAPFPGMDIPWTEEKKAELAKALEPYKVGEQAQPADLLPGAVDVLIRAGHSPEEARKLINETGQPVAPQPLFSLICDKCKIDRLKEPCATPQECPMTATPYVRGAQPVAPDLRKVAEAVREAAKEECADTGMLSDERADLWDEAVQLCHKRICAIDIDAIIESVKGK